MEFEPSGTIKVVEVTSTLSATVEACIADAVRAARIPPFTQPVLRVSFPCRY